MYSLRAQSALSHCRATQLVTSWRLLGHLAQGLEKASNSTFDPAPCCQHSGSRTLPYRRLPGNYENPLQSTQEDLKALGGTPEWELVPMHYLSARVPEDHDDSDERIGMCKLFTAELVPDNRPGKTVKQRWDRKA
jgi:hypothetical protein